MSSVIGIAGSLRKGSYNAALLRAASVRSTGSKAVCANRVPPMGTRPWFGKQLYVAGAAQVFDADGKLVDEKVRKLLTDLVAGFATFVDPNRAPPAP